MLDWSVTPLRAQRLRVRRRPARHRSGAVPRLPQRRQHRPARSGVRPGVPTAEPRVAAAVQPLPVHPAVGHPAGSADRGDPADADRVPRTARRLGVRRRQPGHAGPVRPRPGEPDRHRAGGSAAHQPGPISRTVGPRPPPRSSSATPTSRRAGRASRSIGSSRRPAEPRCSGPCGRSRTRTPPSSSRTGRRSPARRPDEVYILNNSPANGPLISLATPRGRERWPTLWVVTEIYRPAGVRVSVHRAGSVVVRPADAGGRGPADRQLPGPAAPAPARWTSCCRASARFRKVPVVAAPDSAAARAADRSPRTPGSGPIWSRIRPAAGRPPTGRPPARSRAAGRVPVDRGTSQCAAPRLIRISGRGCGGSPTVVNRRSQELREQSPEACERGGPYGPPLA